MQKSTRAVLLSAFLLPGAGHLFLKKYFSASIFVSLSLMSLYVLVSRAVEQALSISDRIVKGDLPLDVEAILALISEQPPGDEVQRIKYATITLGIVWLISIVDSYRVAQIKEGAADSNQAT